MLNTIEEKLSAIRAINESKDRTESLISRTIRMKESAADADIQFNTSRETLLVKHLPDDLKVKILDIVHAFLHEEQTELIEKAKELMR